MMTRQSYMILALTVLLAATAKVQSKPITTISEAQLYLLKFGYLSTASFRYSGTVIENTFRKAIENFQRFTALNITGMIDDETMAIMSLPRCGVSDKVSLSTHKRTKRYVIKGGRWSKSHLTYRISNYPKNLTKTDVDHEIASAFALWNRHTSLSFTPKEAGQVDITIRFATGNHGDNDPFDGPDGTLAHAYYPVRGGAIHFDDDELWAVGSSIGVNLFYVATHELGHSLGLGHSNVVSAVMHPIYYGYKPDMKLQPDDVMGIEKLYGKTNPLSALSSDFGLPHLPPGDEMCRDPKIDTIFQSSDGQVYAFKGNNYYKISKRALAEGYPKRISERWPSLPGDIDAAFSYKTGETYFFKGTEYWRYSGRQMDKNFPRKISEDFIGLPNHVEAAMSWNGIIYFYKGSEFWRFELWGKPAIKYGYPKSISLWKGLPNDLDAAIQLTKDVRFYFKGDKYYQVDVGTFEVNPAVPAYPRPLLRWWFVC